MLGLCHPAAKPLSHGVRHAIRHGARQGTPHLNPHRASAHAPPAQASGPPAFCGRAPGRTPLSGPGMAAGPAQAKRMAALGTGAGPGTAAAGGAGSAPAGGAGSAGLRAAVGLLASSALVAGGLALAAARSPVPAAPATAQAAPLDLSSIPAALAPSLPWTALARAATPDPANSGGPDRAVPASGRLDPVMVPEPASLALLGAAAALATLCRRRSG